MSQFRDDPTLGKQSTREWIGRRECFYSHSADKKGKEPCSRRGDVPLKKKSDDGDDNL